MSDEQTKEYATCMVRFQILFECIVYTNKRKYAFKYAS